MSACRGPATKASASSVAPVTTSEQRAILRIIPFTSSPSYGLAECSLRRASVQRAQPPREIEHPPARDATDQPHRDGERERSRQAAAPGLALDRGRRQEARGAQQTVRSERDLKTRC